MGQKEPLNVVVIGGGPGGLCAAWNLVKDGARVVILEREEVCGGLAKTFERNGYRYDLGPHNFHSKRESVTNFVAKNLGSDFVEWKLKAELYFWGRRIDYPFIGTQILRSLPLHQIAICCWSFLWTRLKSLFMLRFRDDGTYETWVVNRFGRRFYDIFFGPYSLKAWGVPPNELSDIIAKKRIAIRSMVELVRSVLLRRESYHSENPRNISQFYPRGGVGEIGGFFEKGIFEAGGEILNGCHVDKITLNGSQVARITYSQDGEEKVIDFRSDSGAGKWYVLSTLPVNEMVLSLEGDVPLPVIEAAEGLDFSAEVFLYLNIDSEDVFNVPLLYFGQNDFPFNRIYDIGLFSRDMVPPGKNAVCIEITCTLGDETWQMGEKELFEKCIGALEEHGLLDRGRVEDYHVKRIKHAYPRFRVGYQEKLKTIMTYLSGIENLMTFGRQGLFTYANVDDVIWMAFQVTKHLRYRERLQLSHKDLFPEYIDF